MGAMASQITSLTIVYLTVYSGADQRKYQSSASLAFVRGIHRGPVNSPHKWPVTPKMCPFNDVIMSCDCDLEQHEDHTSVTALLEELGWEDLASRRKDARCTLLHKVLNGHVDVDDELRPPYSDTRLRSGASNELKRIPSSMKKCEPYHHSFFPRTVRDWNRLPTPARMTKDLEEFKAALH